MRFLLALVLVLAPWTAEAQVRLTATDSRGETLVFETVHRDLSREFTVDGVKFTLSIGRAPGPQPDPGPDPDPDPPTGFGIEERVRQWTQAAQDPNKAQIVMALAFSYTEVRKLIASGTIRTPQDLAATQVQFNRLVWSAAAPGWDTWDKQLSEYLAQLQGDGALSSMDDWADAWQEIVDGLSSAALQAVEGRRE